MGSFDTEVSYPWPMGHMQPRMAINVVQQKIINLLKTLRDFFFVFVCVCVFNVWLKTTLVPPVRPTDAKSLDTNM